MRYDDHEDDDDGIRRASGEVAGAIWLDVHRLHHSYPQMHKIEFVFVFLHVFAKAVSQLPSDAQH